MGNVSGRSDEFVKSDDGSGHVERRVEDVGVEVQEGVVGGVQGDEGGCGGFVGWLSGVAVAARATATSATARTVVAHTVVLVDGVRNPARAWNDGAFVILQARLVAHSPVTVQSERDQPQDQEIGRKLPSIQSAVRCIKKRVQECVSRVASQTVRFFEQ